jgi:putative polyhydroxyalkanoate system protein
MSVIDITRQHGLAPEDARGIAERLAVRLTHEFGLDYRWEGDVMQFERAGIQGVLVVGERDLHIRARLGGLLSLAGARIEQELHAQLDQALGTAQVQRRRTTSTTDPRS